MKPSNAILTHCGIAIVGCGTVGGASAKLLVDNRALNSQRTGLDIELKYIIDKNLDHARSLGLPEALFQVDVQKALADPEVQIIVELVGGTGFARELVRQALSAGKQVVTANKALLAQHGQELFALARAHNCCIGFEASCGGGIPIIRALYDGLSANKIQALYGIVNGTCNFILTEMIQKGQNYAEALKDAQAAGYAEADPSLDVQGGDSAHKIAIMAGLAFGARIDLSDISVKGFDTLQAHDVATGSDLGYVVKLIAQASKSAKGIHVRVEPAFISRSHPLAWVSGSFNALSVYGHAVGHTLYYGRGAGATPTASAVVSDIISIAAGSYPLIFRQFSIWADLTEKPLIQAENDLIRRHYFRFQAPDQPGVLAKITAIFGRLGISVASIHQPEVPEGGPATSSVPVIVIGHPTNEGNARQALKEICAIEGMSPQASLIPILDERQEFLD